RSFVPERPECKRTAAGRFPAGQWPEARERQSRGACRERQARRRAAFGESVRRLDVRHGSGNRRLAPRGQRKRPWPYQWPARSRLPIGALLRDVAQKDILEGHGTVALDVNAAGKTVNTMKKALAGNARLQLKDGAIKGINLAEVFRKAKTALGSQEARAEARQTQQTDFSEMTASFV